MFHNPLLLHPVSKAVGPAKNLKEKENLTVNGLKIELVHGSPRNQSENIYPDLANDEVEKMVENFMPEAEKTVKVDLGLKKVAELEKISVSDEEIEKEYEAIAKAYSLKPEQAKRLVPAEGLKKDMISRKTVEFICKNAAKK